VRRSLIARFAAHRAGVAAVALLLVIVASCALAPWLAPEGFAGGSLEEALQGPGPRHLLGTDALGRDLLARLLYAGRISLAVAFLVGTITTAVGLAVGLVAGYARGPFETGAMRLVDACLAIPRLPLYLVLLRLLGPGVGTLILVLCLFEWTTVARLAYAGALGESGRLYVAAARALGAPGGRVVWRHVLPNVLPPVIVAFTLALRGLIIAEASLSFLGFGVLPPVPTWGNMLQGVQSQLWSRPWLALYPGLAIFLTTLAVNVLGDAVRDALDPRTVLLGRPTAAGGRARPRLPASASAGGPTAPPRPAAA
jgi:peptide/nickel transport system permease protein